MKDDKNRAIKGRKDRWKRRLVAPGFRLTERDKRIVRSVAEMKYLTCNQVCELYFASGARSNCQRRLTLLTEHRYVDKLPDRGQNEPDVYCVNRKATKAVKLLRQGLIEFKPQVARPIQQLDHVLLINDVRCRLERVCRSRNVDVSEWHDQADLAPNTRNAGFVPDGFFVLAWTIDGRATSAGFFLEVERSPRSPAAMRAKYAHVVSFVRSGEYERRFQRRSLRLLVATSSTSLDLEREWTRRLASLAGQAALSFARFASHRELLSPAADLLSDPLWMKPDTRDACSLLPAENSARGSDATH